MQVKRLFAFSGASMAGKTTLCHGLTSELKKLGRNVGMVTEAARDSHYLHACDRSLPMHLEVAGLHLAAEMRALRMHDIIICDRSIVDFAVLASIRFPHPMGEMDGVYNKTLQAMAECYEQAYTHIFVPVPRQADPGTDTIRRGENVSQCEMHTKTLSYLKQRRICHTELEDEADRHSEALYLIKSQL